MSPVSFDRELKETSYKFENPGPKPSKLVGLLMKMGIVRSEKAGVILLFVIFLLLSSVAAWYYFSHREKVETTPIDPRTGAPYDYFANSPTAQ